MYTSLLSAETNLQVYARQNFTALWNAKSKKMPIYAYYMIMQRL